MYPLGAGGNVKIGWEGAGIRLQHEYVLSLAWWCGGCLCCRGGGVGGCCGGVENVFLDWRHRCVVCAGHNA